MDSYEFPQLAPSLTAEQLRGSGDNSGPIEFKPHFHEWATVQPGMICLARKNRTAQWRQYTAAETAVPVIACAAGLKKLDERNCAFCVRIFFALFLATELATELVCFAFTDYFAGVARSKSVREPDDGIGPKTDEFFTISMGGMTTVLNTSGSHIHPGDLVEWCLATTDAKGTSSAKRMKTGPRRVAIQIASVSSPRVFGRAISFAKAGEPIDILLYALRQSNRARNFRTPCQLTVLDVALAGSRKHRTICKDGHLRTRGKSSGVKWEGENKASTGKYHRGARVARASNLQMRLVRGRSGLFWYRLHC